LAQPRDSITASRLLAARSEKIMGVGVPEGKSAPWKRADGKG